MNRDLWHLQVTASVALLLAVGAVVGLLFLGRAIPKRPSVSCEVKAGEVLVVVVSIDGASVTTPCLPAGGRTK